MRSSSVFVPLVLDVTSPTPIRIVMPPPTTRKMATNGQKGITATVFPNEYGHHWRDIP